MESLRKGLTAVFTLLLCTPMFVLAIFDDHPCAPGQFKVISKNAESFIRCQTCYMCPPGYGVQKECSETADTVCRRCPEGSFSDSSTRQGGCKQCRPCMDEHDTMQECTPNSDRVCRKTCDPGTFLNVERRRCESCSFCHDKPNVNVSRNAQCENQGLPPMWTCWPNITVATDVSEDEIEVDTDETYSYNTASQQRSEGYHQLFEIQLEEYVDFYLMHRTDEPIETSTTTLGINTELGQTLPPRVSTEHTTTTKTSVENHLHVSSVAQRADLTEMYLESVQVRQQCSEGLDAVVFWVVFSTFVLLICLIIAMAIIIYGYRKESFDRHHRQVQDISVQNPQYIRQSFLHCDEDGTNILSTMSLLPPPYSSIAGSYSGEFDFCSDSLSKV